ncbi:MAG: hypothetical protein EOO24_46225 [Comamonadaceae bacterium]|nr:MAG: hypothetical protein EOO24_46225 [Comamonadaceae bacterium]
MAPVVSRLAGWARTSWSAFGELRSSGYADTEQAGGAHGEPIYRLRQWPMLPSSLRTADVLRLLSLMSNRPVNRSWMLRHSKVQPARIERLLAHLHEQDAIEVIDTSAFAPLP